MILSAEVDDRTGDDRGAVRIVGSRDHFAFAVLTCGFIEVRGSCGGEFVDNLTLSADRWHG